MKKMIKVDASTHELVKVEAIKAKMTMEKFVEYLIKKHIEEVKND